MKKIILATVGLILLSFLLIMVLPWKMINWGKVQMNQSEAVTVSGEANIKQKNQIATFTAGVNIVKESKEEAVKEVNQKIAELIDSLKQFGIPAEDIKTQTLSVYQQQDYTKSTSNKTLWSVNNSIEIVLRDISKTTDLTNLLNSSGANNTYGPNFGFDDTTAIQRSLFTDAIKDAREKAEIIANASGRKLGKVIDVVEGGSNNTVPLYSARGDMGGLGGGSPVETGTATISQTVTVTFELQ